MADDCMTTEEHELPVIEAVLAGTLVLMTGYSQALQAEMHPQQRLLMSEKVGSNLSLLVDHPQLSCGFREVLRGLQKRWLAMSACTREAALDCTPSGRSRTPGGFVEGRRGGGERLH